ncbi:MAG: hypothetical protein RLY93_18275 [Sumerlaeia bacterium]
MVHFRGSFTKEFDGDVGLVYMYQRWYNGKIGVFLSEAPYPAYIEDAYSFAEHEPILRADPTGNLWSPCISLNRFSPSYWKRWANKKGRERGRDDKWVHCFLACALRNCFGSSAAIMGQIVHEAGTGFNDAVEDTAAALDGVDCPKALPCGSWCDTKWGPKSPPKLPSISVLCPRIDAKYGDVWKEVGRAIKYNNGKENKSVWIVLLDVPSANFRLVEDEREVSYVEWIKGDGILWGLGSIETSPASIFGATDGSVHYFSFPNEVKRLETYGYYELID